jgi:hypothetical protein
MNPAEVVGYVLLGGLLLVSLWVISASQAKLEEPQDTNVVYLDQLPTIAKLNGQARWFVRIYRQSGNINSESEVTGDAGAALRVAMSTFRRARIDAIGVPENGENRLRFGRLYRSHRGSSEGKKVGSAEIIRIG